MDAYEHEATSIIECGNALRCVVLPSPPALSLSCTQWATKEKSTSLWVVDNWPLVDADESLRCELRSGCVDAWMLGAWLREFNTVTCYLFSPLPMSCGAITLHGNEPVDAEPYD